MVALSAASVAAPFRPGQGRSIVPRGGAAVVAACPTSWEAVPGVVSGEGYAMKKTLACAAVTVVLVLGSGGAAMAGETRGNGDPNDNNGNPHSACHFSGLDVSDETEGNPPGFDDDWAGERGNQSPGGEDRYHGVQSYGSFVSSGAKDLVPSPGEACRGNVAPEG